MSRLVEHLLSAQFVDANGDPTRSGRAGLMYGPGVPRWRGYALCAALAIAAVWLLSKGEGVTDWVTIVGLVGIVGSLVLAIGIWRGRPLIPGF